MLKYTTVKVLVLLLSLHYYLSSPVIEPTLLFFILCFGIIEGKFQPMQFKQVCKRSHRTKRLTVTALSVTLYNEVEYVFSFMIGEIPSHEKSYDTIFFY